MRKEALDKVMDVLDEHCARYLIVVKIDSKDDNLHVASRSSSADDMRSLLEASTMHACSCLLLDDMGKADAIKSVRRSCVRGAVLAIKDYNSEIDKMFNDKTRL